MEVHNHLLKMTCQNTTFNKQKNGMNLQVKEKYHTKK